MEVQIKEAVSQNERRRQRERASQPARAREARSLDDIISATKERRLSQLQQKSGQETGIKLVEAMVGLMQDEHELHATISSLDEQRRHAERGSVQAELASEEITRATEALEQVKFELKHFGKDSPAAFEVAGRRMNQRRAARDLEKTINATDPSGVDARVIKSLVETSVNSGFVAATNGNGVLKWGNQPYNSAMTDDPYISCVAEALANLIGAFEEVKQDRKDATRETVTKDGFLISTRRQKAEGGGPDLPSELDSYRDMPGTARTLTEFLAGQGDRVLVHLNTWGFVLLVREKGRIAATKTTDPNFAAHAFYRTYRGEEKKGPVFLDPDVENIRNHRLREAMKDQLKREAQSQERRDTASKLHNTERLENPLTFTDLKAGRKGVCPVEIRWTVDDGRKKRDVPVSFHLVGNGDGTFELGDIVPGVAEKVDPEGRWLKRLRDAKESTKLDVLNLSSTWKAVAGLNRWHERNWQLELEAKRRGAAPMSRENIGDLTGLEGKDGLYAVRVAWPNGKYPPNHLGFIVERSSSTVKVVWAIPGASASKAEQMTGEQELNDLTPIFRESLFRTWLAVHGMKRNVDGDKAPAHLQLVSEKTNEPETAEAQAAPAEQ